MRDKRPDATTTPASARLWATMAACAVVVFSGLAVLALAKARSTLEPTGVNTRKIVGKNGPDVYVDPKLYLTGIGLMGGGICGAMIFGMLVAQSDAKRAQKK